MAMRAIISGGNGMLAYYVEWHLRQRLKPLLFHDDNPAAAQAARPSIVAPAQTSASALALTTEKGPTPWLMVCK